MRIISLPGVIALAVAVGGLAAPASAQSCPPGYYFASDGRCYPSEAPPAPPPVYYAPAPVHRPPVVGDIALGVGIGALVGVLASRGGGRHDDHRNDHRDDRRHYR